MLNNPIADARLRFLAKQIGVEQISHLKREGETSPRLGLTKPANASRYSAKERRGTWRVSWRRTISGTPTRNAERMTSAWQSRVFLAASLIKVLRSPSTGIGITGDVAIFIVNHYSHSLSEKTTQNLIAAFAFLYQFNFVAFRGINEGERRSAGTRCWAVGKFQSVFCKVRGEFIQAVHLKR